MACPRGKRTRTSVPSRSPSPIVTVPPHLEASSWAIARPRPEPPAGAPRPAEEALRDAPPLVGRDPGAAVAHRDPCGLRVGPGGDADRPGGVRDRVVDQDVQDLVHVGGVGRRRRRRRRCAVSSAWFVAARSRHRETVRRAAAAQVDVGRLALLDPVGASRAVAPRSRPVGPPRRRRPPVAGAAPGRPWPPVADSSRSFIPVSGVRSWCEAFATNSRCARTVASRRAAIASNDRPRSWTSRGAPHVARARGEVAVAQAMGGAGQPLDRLRDRSRERERDDDAGEHGGAADDAESEPRAPRGRLDLGVVAGQPERADGHVLG